MRLLTIAATVAAAAGLLTAPATAQAANLLGQSFSYCTNSVYDGAVTADPGACDTGVAFTEGDATVVDPGVEVALLGTGTRNIDLSDLFIDVIYDSVSSFSPDLFVLTGFEGITGLTLVGDNPLNLTWTFSSDAIGLLVNAPLENGTVRLQVTTDQAIAVPEPGAWALMILGFGCTGALLRRRSVPTAA